MSEVIDGRYEVREAVGRGVVGSVLRVFDRVRRREAALKTVRAEGEESGRGGGEADAVRLREEFRTMHRLAHPNIVRTYDFGETQRGIPYFTMEFVNGEPITQACRTLDWRHLIPLVLQICDALDYVHQRGIVHADLKPANILIWLDWRRERRRVKLTDFGLARHLGEPEERGVLAGTIPYLSPEAIEGKPLDGRADIYSLGVVLYQIVGGRLPFDGHWRDILEQHLRAPPLPLRGIAPQMPRELCEIVERSMEKSLARRFPSAASLAAELSRLRGPKEREGRSEVVLLEEGEFVGREKELGMLKSLMDRAARGSGQVAVVTGEEGIGISRLLAELRSWAQLQGHCVIDLQEGGRGEVTDLLLEGLRRCALRVGGDACGESAASIDTIDGYLEPVSRSLPVLIILDSLEPDDATAVGMLVHIAGMAVDLPVMVCVGTHGTRSGAPPGRRGLGEIAGARTIALEGLGAEEVRELVGSMTRCRQVQDEIVRLLDLHTGGNPLLVRECVKTLAARGTIAAEGDECRLAPGERETAVPSSVGRAVGDRFEVLSDPARVVAGIVAVAGGTCERRWVAELAGLVEDELSRAAAELEESGLLNVDESGEKLEYRHRLYGEAIYAHVEEAIRSRWHGEMARRLEQDYRGREAQVAGRLALHWMGAHERDTARRYFVLAGKGAARASRAREAIGLFRRAHALAALPGDLASLAERLGDLHAMCGERADAVARYREALSCYGTAEEIRSGIKDGSTRGVTGRARLLHKLGTLDERRGPASYEESERLYREAIRLYRSVGEESKAGSVLVDLGWLRSLRGEYEQGLRICEQAKEVLASGNLTEEHARALTAIGSIHLKRGELGECVRFHEESLELSRTSGDKAGMARAYHNLGMAHLDGGAWEEAAREFEEAITLREELGNEAAVALLSNTLGACLVKHGEWEKARRVLEHAIVLARRSGDLQVVRRATKNLGAGYYLRARDLGRAARCYEEFLAMEETPSGRAQTSLLLGAIYDETGEWDRARSHYLRALRISARHRERERMARIYCNLGSLYGRRGDRRRGMRCLEKSLASARVTGNDSLVAAVISSAVEVFARRGELDRARRLLGEARALVQGTSMEDERAELDLREAELALLEREPDRALGLLFRVRARAERAGDEIKLAVCSRLEGRASAMKDLWEQAGRCFEESIDGLREMDSAFELALTCMEYALFKREYGYLDGAVDMMVRARDIFSRLGAGPERERSELYLNRWYDEREHRSKG